MGFTSSTLWSTALVAVRCPWHFAHDFRSHPPSLPCATTDVRECFCDVSKHALSLPAEVPRRHLRVIYLRLAKVEDEDLPLDGDLLVFVQHAIIHRPRPPPAVPTVAHEVHHCLAGHDHLACTAHARSFWHRVCRLSYSFLFLFLLFSLRFSKPFPSQISEIPVLYVRESIRKGRRRKVSDAFRNFGMNQARV